MLHVNEDHKEDFTMQQVKSKMQALKKQYRDIVNSEKETGNKKAPTKPDYWEEMLYYFTHQDGLSGQSVVNLNPTQAVMGTTGVNLDDSSDSDEEEEEIDQNGDGIDES